jgi:tetratricopeptide (TPR) repeat protein
VAKVNPAKLKQEAEAFEKGGRLDLAIAKYRQIVDENPRDWNTVKKIGDLYVRLNRNREAIGEYEKLADFYAKDGFLLKAIAIWKQIQKLDGTALEPYVHLAELYAKQGLMMEAKGQYQIVVDEHLKRGKTREAGEFLKRLADIDPGDLKIRSRLADLYQRDGNAAQAVEEHVAIAEELSRKGHLAEAAQVLEKGLKLDPRSYRLRSELARIHLAQRNFDKAIQFLEEAVQLSPADPRVLSGLGEAYLGARRLEEAEAIFKRLLELNPQDEDSKVQMGRLHLSQGEFDLAFERVRPVVERALANRDAEKAITLLQQIVQRDPQHVRSLEKLVEIYRQLHRETALSAAYSQLTEAYLAEERFDRAAGVLEALVEREPANQQHRTKLEFVRGRLAAEGKPAHPVLAPREPAAASDFLEEDFDLAGIAEPASAPSPVPIPPREPASRPPSSPAAPRPIARVESSGPLSAEDREFIEEHLAEGRVFRKYGLTEKSIDQFEAVVARFPDNVEARQELRDLYREKGATAKVVEQSLAMAEISRLKGDESAADEHEADARRAGPPPAPAARAAAPPSFGLADEEEEISIEVEEGGFELAEPATATPAVEGAGEFRLEDDSVEELPIRFLEEEEALPALEPEPTPLPATPLPPTPLPSLEPASAPDVPMAAAAPEPTSEPPAIPAAPPVPLAPTMPAELRRTLDEVEQYVALGFVDDARDLIREIAGRYSTAPALLAKASELGLDLDSGRVVLEPEIEEPILDLDLGVTEPAAAPIAALEEPAESPPAPAFETDLDLDMEPVTEEAAPAVPADAAAVEEPAFTVDDTFAETEAEAPVADEAPTEEEPFAEVDVSLAGVEEEPAIEEPAVEEPPSFGVEAPAEEPEEPFPAMEEPLPELAAPAAVLPDVVEDESPFDLPEPELETGLPPMAPAREGLELGDELGELFGMQQAVEPAEPAASTTLEDSGLADIFKEFRKGVDKQLGKEDYDTRYNLGIAYKEMGLLDEAIAEFQLAARDENRMLECSSMLGICFMEKGMPKLAVKWFERGLAVTGRSEEEYQGLRYDLASAHAAAGEEARALSIFTDLYGQNASFRDVAAKVRELSAGR